MCFVVIKDSCELLDLEWLTFTSSKLDSAGVRIETLDMAGNGSECDRACLDQYSGSVCHSYDYNNVTNNCTLMSSDYITMATTLTESEDDTHKEWQCHNGRLEE